jgi:Domain of unknown function (DU1801)
MAEQNKTQPTTADVQEFLSAVPNATRQADARVLCDLMAELTGEQPTMWGPTMIGFGRLRYRYASGREGDWFLIGFSPRKQALTVYLTDGLDRHQALLAKLGKHRTGVGCLYITKLADVDDDVLRQLLAESVHRE